MCNTEIRIMSISLLILHCATHWCKVEEGEYATTTQRLHGSYAIIFIMCTLSVHEGCCLAMCKGRWLAMCKGCWLAMCEGRCLAMCEGRWLAMCEGCWLAMCERWWLHHDRLTTPSYEEVPWWVAFQSLTLGLYDSLKRGCTSLDPRPYLHVCPVEMSEAHVRDVLPRLCW